MTATNVSDFRTAFEFRGDAVQGRQPRTDEIVLIAWAKEASGRAEQTLRLIAQPTPLPERNAGSTSGWFSSMTAAMSKAGSR